MAAKKGGLGRGLDALLMEEPLKEGSVLNVSIYDVDTNPNQPRKSFDEERLNELSESIKRHGIMQPILVKKTNGRYLIIAGERRFRAARLAELKTVPVLLSDADENSIAELALVENIQRENLNPIEEAAAIRFLMKQHDLTQEEVSSRIGKSRPVVANSLRLLSLPQPVCELVSEGKLSSGHGRVLAGLNSASRQILLANRAAKDGWSVRRMEDEVRLLDLREARSRKNRSQLDPELVALTRALRQKLGAKVAISGTNEKGKIVISYESEEALQNVYDALFGENQ